MYKNIVFDLGGVLVEWKPHDYLLERFCDAATEQKIYDITFGGPEWKQLDAGELTRFAANQLMLDKAKAAGCRFEVQEVIDDWENMLRTRRAVVTIATELKSRGFRLYYLSNIPADVADRMKRRSFWRLFDGGICSCDVHLLKPQPEIYRLLLDTYKLEPKECIYIDDSGENVKAAYQLGFTAIPMKGSAAGLVRNLGVCGIKLR